MTTSDSETTQSNQIHPGSNDGIESSNITTNGLDWIKQRQSWLELNVRQRLHRIRNNRRSKPKYDRKPITEGFIATTSKNQQQPTPLPHISYIIPKKQKKQYVKWKCYNAAPLTCKLIVLSLSIRTCYFVLRISLVVGGTLIVRWGGCVCCCSAVEIKGRWNLPAL